MGMFSYITNDTLRSIPAQMFDMHMTVYMTDDKGNQWEESGYQGYGEFGGKDFYMLTAEMNNKQEQARKAIPARREHEAMVNPGRTFSEDELYQECLRLIGIDIYHHPERHPGAIYPSLTEDPDRAWTGERPGYCPDQGAPPKDDPVTDTVHGGYRIRIYQEQYPEDPRTISGEPPLVEMIALGKYEYLFDKHEYIREDFTSWKDMHKQLAKDAAAILPLYVYEHGIIRTNTTGFSCQWDTSHVGFARIPKATAEENWPDASTERLLDIIRSAVDELDMYFTGQIYAVVITDRDGEHVSSLGDIYGEDEAVKAAQSEIDALNADKKEPAHA